MEITQGEAGAPDDSRVTIPVGASSIAGALNIPADAVGIVVCMQGVNEDRRDDGYQRVAEALRRRGVATLVFDPLTGDEKESDRNEASRGPRVPTLTERFREVTRYLVEQHPGRWRSCGYFGTGVGAVAALLAAAQEPEFVRAIVGRGAQPGLALESLGRIRAPTLLIVSEADQRAVRLNREALAGIPGGGHLEVIPDAAQWGEELAQHPYVTELTATWFSRYLMQRENAAA